MVGVTGARYDPGVEHDPAPFFVTFKSQVYTYSLCFAEPSPCQTENGSEHLRPSELSFRSGILRISVIRAGIIRYDADVYYSYIPVYKFTKIIKLK